MSLPERRSMQADGPIIVVAGTRPEAIKMMPVYFALKDAGQQVLFCSTMQHDQLLYDVLDLFAIKPDVDLGVMRINQDLFYITQSLLQKSKELYQRVHPSLVLVQGDTSSTMACALAAFYLKIPVGHIEAGLRTYDKYAPFPEEMNRKVVSAIATYHFTPTDDATVNLLAEGIVQSFIYCTGNTVADALRIVKQHIAQGTIVVSAILKERIAQCKKGKIILFTMHRRESFNGALSDVLKTLVTFLIKHPFVYCFYPYHPNPHVIHALQSAGLSGLANCFLFEPMSYQDMVYLLDNVDLVLTDSGGIQEEAICLGKPVLVLREKTERQEGIKHGMAHLIGFNTEKLESYLNASIARCNMFQPSMIYGDGYAAQQIVSIIKEQVNCKKSDQVASVTNYMVPTKRYNEDIMKKVTVLGLGYIGLPTSIVLADAGFDVIGFDVDSDRIEAINKGEPVIQEPDLFEKLHVALLAGHFKATNVMNSSDYFIIAVPTPFKEGKRADLSYVMSAASHIASVLKKGDVVILESTVPVGATDMLAAQLCTQTGLMVGKDFYVAHCPERVLPGNIFKELIENDRIIGGVDKISAFKARELYETFAQGALYITDTKSAEMVKLIENSSRDVQIAFAHQVASMALVVGLNPYEIIELANKHPRVNILKPSAGVGGHCIAVDPWFLIETFREQTQLLQAARYVNDARPLEVVEKIYKVVSSWRVEQQRNCNVLLMGLTYKPDIDDVRESAAIRIANMLCEHQSINLFVCEPHLNQRKLQALYHNRAVSVTEGVQQADMIIFLVGHTRFKAIDKKLLNNKKLLDFCGILEEPKREQEYLYWPASVTSSDMYDISEKPKVTQNSQELV